MAFLQTTDIGIDLGTSSTLVYVRGKGIIKKEPSVVAIDTFEKNPIAYGEEARKMIGRTPENITAVKPLKHGVISNISLTEKMLKHFMDEALGKFSLRKPRIVVCVPAMCTEIERKAVEDATYNAGARSVDVIEGPLAAAMGADIDIERAEGSMIVDIGGGTSDIAIISLGGCVCASSIKIAGEDFDQAIVEYMRSAHHLLIGDRSAENIKMKIGRAIPLEEGEDLATLSVKGRSIQTGYPGEKLIDDVAIYGALQDSINEIIKGIKKVFEATPPELATDIFEKGIYLTGGGSLLYGMDKLIEKEISVPVLRVDDPMRSVILGIQKRIMQYTRNDI